MVNGVERRFAKRRFKWNFEMIGIVSYHLVAPGILWVCLADGERRQATAAERKILLRRASNVGAL